MHLEAGLLKNISEKLTETRMLKSWEAEDLSWEEILTENREK